MVIKPARIKALSLVFRFPRIFYRGALIGLLCLFAVIGLLAVIDDRLGPPITSMYGARPVTGTAYVGGFLVMEIKSSPGRLCSAQISRYLVRIETAADGRMIRNYFPLYSPASPLSDPEKVPMFRISLQVPAGITPGEYRYVAHLSSWCGFWGVMFGDDTTSVSPDVPIVILPRM